VKFNLNFNIRISGKTPSEVFRMLKLNDSIELHAPMSSVPVVGPNHVGGL